LKNFKGLSHPPFRGTMRQKVIIHVQCCSIGRSEMYENDGDSEVKFFFINSPLSLVAESRFFEI
jgi:hypothetical protein